MTDQQRVYLTRLARLLRLQQDYRDELNDLGMALLRRGITATLVDCRDAGCGDEAEWKVPASRRRAGTDG